MQEEILVKMTIKGITAVLVSDLCHFQSNMVYSESFAGCSIVFMMFENINKFDQLKPEILKIWLRPSDRSHCRAKCAGDFEFEVISDVKEMKILLSHFLDRASEIENSIKT